MPQSYTSLHYHILFGTKDRRGYLVDDLRRHVLNYIAGIIQNENGQLLAAGGTDNHVHLLAGLHAEKALADVLRVVKTNSSKWIHENHRNLPGFAWQPGYGAFSVSRSNLGQVREYIDNQQEHHRRTTFEEEFKEFLDRHGVSHDARYLFA